MSRLKVAVGKLDGTAVVGADDEFAPIGIDRLDRALGAVEDSEAAGVTGGHHPIPDREAPLGYLDLFPQPAGVGHEQAGHAIELVGIRSALGEHDAPSPVLAMRPPLRDSSLADDLGVAVPEDRPVLDVGRDGLEEPSGPEVVKGLALPWVLLAAVLGEIDRLDTVLDPPEGATGIDLGGLAVISGEDHLRPRVLGDP